MENTLQHYTHTEIEQRQHTNTTNNENPTIRLFEVITAYTATLRFARYAREPEKEQWQMSEQSMEWYVSEKAEW